MQDWLLRTKVYSTIASSVIDELIELQSSASMSELGGDQKDDDSSFRRKASISAPKRLQEGHESSLVSVALLSFKTPCDETVPEVKTVVPLNVSPSIAMIALDPKVLQWVFTRAHAILPPNKR
eukprot:6484925-Pyramimonas_sp.AAC.1